MRRANALRDQLDAFWNRALATYADVIEHETRSRHDTPCVNLSSCAGVWSPLAPRTLRVRPSDLKDR